MSSAARDRTARVRIREYLANHGSVEDPDGRATAALKDAVEYEGSSVAFIQLVAAMDKAEEISREIRGKRTYKISTTEVQSGAARQASDYTVPSGSAKEGFAIDYDELARALLRELARVLSGSSVPAQSAPRDDRAERDRLVAERDEYARRLQAARQQLGTLLNESMTAFDAAAPNDMGTSGRGERAS